ncbi:MAG: hypothetical protein ACXVSL_07540 [Solirubrobacteraceae bacterium]
MRKLALAGIAGMLIGGAAVAAVASSPARVSAVPARLDAGSPSHPQGVKLTTALSWDGLKPGNAPTINKIDLWFPTGTRYDGAGYPSCSYARLNAAGPSACPKSSIMGSGVATAFADTVVTRPRITVVNGGADRVYFYTVLNNPARVQVPVIGQITRLPGRFAYHLSATIPPRLLVVAGVPIRFTALQVSAGRGTWLATTAPPAGIKIVTSFSDGTKITGLVWVQDI